MCDSFFLSVVRLFINAMLFSARFDKMLTGFENHDVDDVMRKAVKIIVCCVYSNPPTR